MLVLRYDPATTELSFREVFIPPVIANFNEFTLTTELNLTAGMVTVTGRLDITETGTLAIDVTGVIEIL